MALLWKAGTEESFPPFIPSEQQSNQYEIVLHCGIDSLIQHKIGENYAWEEVSFILNYI